MDAWILIDAYSWIPIDTLGQLARLQLVGARFVLFGDHEGRFEPMRDRWDTPYSKVADSLLLRDMCCRMHLKLQTYQRGTDQQLFDNYTRLYKNVAADKDFELPSLVNRAQSKYPAKLSSPFDYYLVLCVSHAHRMLCNARLNEGKAVMAEAVGKTTRLVEWSGDDIKGTTCQPQTMILWEGIELIGCPRGTGMKTQIVQGVIYTVVYIDDQTVVLQMRKEYTEKLNPEDEDDEVHEVTVPLGDVPALLRLTHAMCYFTCQGRSIDLGKPVLMIDTHHKFFTRRALIVGMSRVRRGDDLHIATLEYEACVTGRLRKTFRSI